ncbi:MAG TPA: hypothetical protein VE195_11050, partial [Acidobacteriaceae bacterium]|nr:hypothetical protein [Acidobacteriaceae bacterium]
MRVLPNPFRAFVLSLCAFALLGWMTVDGQSAAPTAPTQAPPITGAPNNQGDVLNHLNRVLQWFHLWSGAGAYAVVPGDELFVEYGQDMARKVVDLEFKSALAQAALLAGSGSKPLSTSGNAPSAADAQNLVKFQQNVDQKLRALNTELDTIDREIATARAKERPALQTQRDTVQGQIALAQALQSNLQQLTSFMNSTDIANGVATELSAKIRALQRTVPAALTPEGTATEKPATKSAATTSQIQFPTFAGARSEGLVG